MTLLMALHHTHDGFWYFFRCYKSNSFLAHFQLSICQWKAIFHQGSCVFRDVILVSNYHSYKEKTIKLLPYNSFYGGHIPPRKVDPPFSGSLPQENTKPPRSPFSSIPLKNFKLHLSWSLQHSKLSKYGYYFFSAEYELITCY